MTRPGILVTRPEPQAQQLCESLETAGFRAFRLPAIAIEPNVQPVSIDAAGYDLIVFVSRNAVIHGLPRLHNQKTSLRHAAVGKGTAEELTQRGIQEVLIPDDRWDSEGLLAKPELADTRGKAVLIIRGDGGRGLLASSLCERGARVDFVEVYRRALSTTSPAEVLAHWDDIQLVLATSNAILDHLEALLGSDAQKLLGQKTLLLVSQRGLAHARDLGYTSLVEASGASDAELIAALAQWRQDTYL